jgi:hypothetical protein
VHCKAGKSRSVTIVLAYLIHANAWTLKTAYDFVADRRPGISPNIGFVAELMQYAHRELGLRPTRAPEDEVASPGGEAPGEKGGGQGDGKGGGTKKARNPRARDSMPAGWGKPAPPQRLSPAGPSGLGPGGDTGEEDRRVDEREVRRGGQWIARRR